MPNPISVLRRAGRAVRFGFRSREGVFKHIFESRYWGDNESVSGVGSSLAQTEQIRTDLPKLVAQFGIKSILDAPCGDLNWIKHILPEMGIDYIGADIVEGVVELARSNNKYDRARFMQLDIVKGPLPEADLWLCRDVLFHLSFNEIRSALTNFRNSGINYILVTSHKGAHVPNWNMVTGDFRELNLFKSPFALPQDKVVYRFDDYAPPMPAREMVMFRREDLEGHFGL
ncbi:MAG: methyltransferase domain-containing protein [Sandarakinorhabdus sp.]|jgi:hypothetical protein|nr:methyltransferase domain-containing protein [Sandarakinorhabdus sp.]